MEEREDRREPAPDEIRDAVRAWLTEAWDPDLSLIEWRNRLMDARWGCVSWPTRWWGRGWSRSAAEVVAAELEAVGAPGVAAGAGMSLAAPTILTHGPDHLRAALLRPTATGELTWCQLFSEPGSGSDLAGLTTRAVLDGDAWVVTGQKVWTTGAATAAMGMLLARTDWDVPKHRGITYFALPMRQPGVEVRPLRQMNGYASFNEVFLTEARVPADHVIGEVNAGWAVALTTLAHERGLAALRVPRAPAAGEGRAASEARAEAEAYRRTYVWYPQRAGRPDLLAHRVRSPDAVLRQRAARAWSTHRAATLTARRAAAARAAGTAGPEGSVLKLLASRVAREAAAVHGAALGAHAMLTGSDAPDGGLTAEILLSVPAQSIAGGTDEIQHNIVGERVLGLPREPQVDRDIPFREVRTNLRGRGGPGGGDGRAGGVGAGPGR